MMFSATSKIASQGLPSLVGRTPLVRLPSLSAQTGCEILAKAEWMNPGGSVKDRAALSIVAQAEASGELVRGEPGVVVEGTAGNTGIGLAHICLARGYKCVIFIPETQSKEKMDSLRALGCDLRPVPAVPYSNPAMYQHQAARYAEQLRAEGVRAVWGNQFDNCANRDAHIHTTGPELWQATDGRLDAFVSATGTGGTLAGTGVYLKQRDPNVQVVLADPPGSCLYSYVKTGELKRTGEGSITEGIGNGRITDNLKDAPIDDAVFVSDQETLGMLFHLLHYEGIPVGASAALNTVAAVQVAKRLGPGHTVATMLCDGLGRYQSRLLSRAWLEQKDLTDALPEYADRYLID